MSASPNLIVIPQLFLFSLLFSVALSQSHDSLFCESWRFSIETNNAGNWSTIPKLCFDYVKDYMSGDRYLSDNKMVAENALEFAKSVHIAGDGKDAWIFDVDDTSLSHLHFYETHGFGIKVQEDLEFRKWVLGGKVPALHSTLMLYKELRRLGFSIFFLTGRPEYIRNITEANLCYAGFTHWERLLLRRTSDLSKLAIEYKSEKRKQLEDEGYRIRGSSGDQWSDLHGFSVAERSFKVPNPTYYVA